MHTTGTHNEMKAFTSKTTEVEDMEQGHWHEDQGE